VKHPDDGGVLEQVRNPCVRVWRILASHPFRKGRGKNGAPQFFMCKLEFQFEWVGHPPSRFRKRGKTTKVLPWGYVPHQRRDDTTLARAASSKLELAHLYVFEAVTKPVPSAKADSVCSTFAFPALPCRAFRCRRYAAGAEFVPPSRGFYRVS
jgi:hypothetical protein